MKKSSTLIMVSALAAALQVAPAADITGTITLKGTPPKEKEITPMMEDANCSKLHTKAPTTRFYVAGRKASWRMSSSPCRASAANPPAPRRHP